MSPVPPVCPRGSGPFVALQTERGSSALGGHWVGILDYFGKVPWSGTPLDLFRIPAEIATLPTPKAALPSAPVPLRTAAVGGTAGCAEAKRARGGAGSSHVRRVAPRSGQCAGENSGFTKAPQILPEGDRSGSREPASQRLESHAARGIVLRHKAFREAQVRVGEWWNGIHGGLKIRCP